MKFNELSSYVLGKGFYITFPQRWRANEASYGYLAFGPEEHGKFYITVGGHNETSNYNGKLDELPKVTKDTLIKNLARTIYDIEKLDISIKSSEYLVVNDLEYIKINGIINMDSMQYSYDQEMNFVAYYSVITVEYLDVIDQPIFIGVLDYSEKQSDIENAEKVLDAMVETIHLAEKIVY